MTYDYIVVGAGSAGAALAGRLSDDPAVTVLLLEAGPDYRAAEAPPEMRSPNFVPIMDPARFPQFQYPALVARRTPAQAPRPFLRGRGLGGSSAINSQAAIRGVPEDFDGWAAQGCAGWAWRDVLPAFVRLEDDLDFGDRPGHGRGGPVPVCRAPLAEWGAVDQALRAAALDLGYGWHEDHNAPGSTGVSPYASNSRAGVRVSTNDAYLEPARGRPNLTIRGEALVDRVRFVGRRATGVRVRLGGAWTEVAAREVVLCAGAIHSPAILARSGVGPAADLRALGIAPVRDAPVGRNLSEHAIVYLALDLAPAVRAAGGGARLANCCVRYGSGLAEAGPNDMVLASINALGADAAGRARGLLCVAVFRTFSRGRVRITSPAPDRDPEVEFRLLSDGRDLVRLRDGVQRLWAVLDHPALRAIVEGVSGLVTGRRLAALPADGGLDGWLMEEVTDFVHPVGTCRMGAADDPRSVVDPACRVIGVEGLRVVDASIMPDVPRANTHLTCVMLAEHLAARLRR